MEDNRNKIAELQFKAEELAAQVRDLVIQMSFRLESIPEGLKSSKRSEIIVDRIDTLKEWIEDLEYIAECEI